jgi:hypothetical protein
MWLMAVELQEAEWQGWMVLELKASDFPLVVARQSNKPLLGCLVCNTKDN